MTDLEKSRRELARWRILRALDAGRPGDVDEQLLLMALNDAQVALTPSELRRELDYLCDRKLVTLEGQGESLWRASLTHHGVDIVEYAVPCLPGIARPPKG